MGDGAVMHKQLYPLTSSERESLERRYKHTSRRRISERIQAILLLDAGHSREQVAQIVHVNPKTISRWVDIFTKAGVDALCTLQYAGNRGALTPIQQERLLDWLEARDRSLKQVITWVEQEFQVHYTESGMRKLLQRLETRRSAMDSAVAHK